MQIRRAHESEAPRLSSIAFESKAHWTYSSSQLAAWRDELTVSPGAVSSCPTYVAELEGRVVGFFMLVPSSPNWRLEHFWVSPRAWGAVWDGRCCRTRHASPRKLALRHWPSMPTPTPSSSTWLSVPSVWVRSQRQSKERRAVSGHSCCLPPSDVDRSVERAQK